MSTAGFPAATVTSPADVPAVFSRAAATLSTWPLWAVAFASTSVIVGVVWDISWHRSIGRDSFWTPAHMAIYLGGAVAGLSCGWVVLRTWCRRSLPILLVASALVIDLVVNRTPAGAGRLRWGATAVCAGLAAMLALTAVQWPFAEFLLTEPARNFLFAADQFGYDRAPGPYQYVFWGRPMTAGFSGWTALIAAASAVAGLWWGNWMTRVRR